MGGGSPKKCHSLLKNWFHQTGNIVLLAKDLINLNINRPFEGAFIVFKIRGFTGTILKLTINQLFVQTNVYRVRSQNFLLPYLPSSLINKNLTMLPIYSFKTLLLLHWSLPRDCSLFIINSVKSFVVWRYGF